MASACVCVCLCNIWLYIITCKWPCKGTNSMAGCRGTYEDVNMFLNVLTYWHWFLCIKVSNRAVHRLAGGPCEKREARSEKIVKLRCAFNRTSNVIAVVNPFVYEMQKSPKSRILATTLSTLQARDSRESEQCNVGGRDRKATQG